MGYRKIFDYGVNIHTYEFNPKEERFSYEIGENMKLETIDKLPRPKDDESVACVINWNFFDTKICFNGYGEIEVNGKQIQGASALFPSLSFKDNKLTYGDIKGADIGLGIGILLVLDGKKNIINKGKVPSGKDTRTAFGQKKNGNIFIVVCEGNDLKSKGLSANDMADFLLKNDVYIGAMGDSGGSSGMMINGKYIYKNENRKIAAGLVVYKKKTNLIEDKPTSEPKKDIRKTTSDLNIRKSPTSLLPNKVGIYPKNSLIEVLEIQGNWCRTAKGWVSGSYLVKV